MRRLFLGIEIPSHLATSIQPICQTIVKGRKTNIENWHLTLVFLGKVDENLFEKLCLLEPEPIGKSFILQLHKLGLFVLKRQIVLWAGVVFTQELFDLQKQVFQKIKDLGCKVSDQQFNPHVTIARYKKDGLEEARSLIEKFDVFRSPPCFVQGFYLYESTKNTYGLTYIKRAFFSLDNNRLANDLDETAKEGCR